MSLSATASPIENAFALVEAKAAATVAAAANEWIWLVLSASTSMPPAPPVIVDISSATVPPSINAVVSAAMLFCAKTPPALNAVPLPDAEMPTATEAATVSASMVWVEVAETPTLLPPTIEWRMRASVLSGVATPGASMEPA